MCKIISQYTPGYSSEGYLRGTGPIIDYVACNGSEKELLDCMSFTHSYGCSHNEDVGIQCTAGILFNLLSVICKHHPAFG